MQMRRISPRLSRGPTRTQDAHLDVIGRLSHFLELVMKGQRRLDRRLRMELGW
jgi:hypothetical protein